LGVLKITIKVLPAITVSEVNPELLSRRRILNELKSIQSLYSALFDVIIYHINIIDNDLDIIKNIVQKYRGQTKPILKPIENKEIIQRIDNINKIVGQMNKFLNSYNQNQFQVYKEKMRLIDKQMILFIDEVRKREKEGLEKEGNTEKVIRFFLKEIRGINIIFKDTIQTIEILYKAYKENISQIIKQEIKNRPIFIIETYTINISSIIEATIGTGYDMADNYHRMEIHFTILLKNVQENWEF
jgi:hypothetical protein